MSDGKYNDWVYKNYDDLAVGFAEKMEEEFEDYCFQRFTEPREPMED